MSFWEWLAVTLLLPLGAIGIALYIRRLPGVFDAPREVPWLEAGTGWTSLLLGLYALGVLPARWTSALLAVLVNFLGLLALIFRSSLVGKLPADAAPSKSENTLIAGVLSPPQELRHPRRSMILGLVWMAAVVAVNDWAIETWSGRDYLRWYIENGAIISLGFAFFAAAVDLDKVEDLISAHPLRFAAASFNVIGASNLALGAGLFAFFGDLPADKARGSHLPPGRIVDLFTAYLLWFPLILALFVWLILIVPAQYFIYLVAGAPARLLHASETKVLVRIDRGGMRYEQVARQNPTPPDSLDVSAKPVTTTALVASVLLLTASRFL